MERLCKKLIKTCFFFFESGGVNLPAMYVQFVPDSVRTMNTIIREPLYMSKSACRVQFLFFFKFSRDTNIF